MDTKGKLNSGVIYVVLVNIIHTCILMTQQISTGQTHIIQLTLMQTILQTFVTFFLVKCSENTFSIKVTHYHYVFLLSCAAYTSRICYYLSPPIETFEYSDTFFILVLIICSICVDSWLGCMKKIFLIPAILCCVGCILMLGSYTFYHTPYSSNSSLAQCEGHHISQSNSSKSSMDNVNYQINKTETVVHANQTYEGYDWSSSYTKPIRIVMNIISVLSFAFTCYLMKAMYAFYPFATLLFWVSTIQCIAATVISLSIDQSRFLMMLPDHSWCFVIVIIFVFLTCFDRIFSFYCIKHFNLSTFSTGLTPTIVLYYVIQRTGIIYHNEVGSSTNTIEIFGLILLVFGSTLSPVLSVNLGRTDKFKSENEDSSTRQLINTESLLI